MEKKVGRGGGRMVEGRMVRKGKGGVEADGSGKGGAGGDSPVMNTPGS